MLFSGVEKSLDESEELSFSFNDFLLVFNLLMGMPLKANDSVMKRQNPIVFLMQTVVQPG